jgi:DNA-binding response OmpR family regulator
VAVNVLIVEDNPDIVANLYEFLEPRGFVLDHARTGHEGLRRVRATRFDAIILDVMLPGIEGTALCHLLRQELHQTTPVLMLTARDTLDDKLLGFASGADDYLVKPFLMAELEARIHALVRRSRGGVRRQGPVRVGDLSFDGARHEVHRAGKRLALTPTGYKLLACLLHAAPRVVMRQELERAVWGDDPPDSDALRTHLHALRQAVDKPFAQRMIKTIPGVGYRLAADE